MSRKEFIKEEVLEARKKGLIKCPCGAVYSRFLKRCPGCGLPNPTKFE